MEYIEWTMLLTLDIKLVLHNITFLLLSILYINKATIVVHTQAIINN